MIKEPVVVAAKVRSFSCTFFSQVSQNVTVKARVGPSVKRNKFTVNNPLHAEKKPNELALC
jgi:hypothetical protein